MSPTDEMIGEYQLLNIFTRSNHMTIILDLDKINHTSICTYNSQADIKIGLYKSISSCGY